MRVRVIGDESNGFLDKVRAAGLEVVESDPEVIIAYGGDGAFIGAERVCPGVPKLGIRHESTCIKCKSHRDEDILAALKAGRLERHELLKIEATFDGHRILAMNDVILRNTDPRAAVRFHVHLDGQRVTEELIADGLVVCTPFGSSAYFRSITRTVIRTGIGVAFNNCTDLLQHLVIAEHEALEVKLKRGPATLAADNDPTFHSVSDGQSVLLRRAPQPAVVLAVDTLRCPECRYRHAPRRRY